MDFDEMLEAWRAQDDKPLYGVNGDLLRLVLQNEQAAIWRKLRRDRWVAYIFGPAMTLFAAFWLWVVIIKHGPLLQTIAAAIGAATFMLWAGAFWLSHRRQAKRERGFGNSLRDEIGRSLSLIEYQIANGRRDAALLWTAPVIIGSFLIYWLMFQINTSSGFSWWSHVWIVGASAGTIIFAAFSSDQDVKQKLEPRRDHLRHLLETLDASE